MAAERAEEILNELAAPIPRNDLIEIVNTSLKDYKGDWISKKIVEMVSGIKEQFGEVDLDRIAIHAIEGGGIDDSFLVEGSTLFGWALPSSKKRVEGAKIAIIEKPLEINMGETVSGMRFKDSKELSRCFHEEEELLRAMVNRIVHVGANVVISMGSIDVRAQGMLTQKGVFITHHYPEYHDLRHLARATGATFVNDILSISADDLGEAELVEERRMAEEDMIIIDGCKNGSSTLLVRGGSKQLADEYKRIVHTAISSLAKTLDDMRAVPGGGAIEIELAKRIRAWAVTVRSKRQFAIAAFARSLEIIPKALATNAGLDQVEILTELRQLHEKNPSMGVYIAEDGAYIDDTLKHGVIDPFVVKRQMIHGALEAAELIILVDGILQDKSRERKLEASEAIKKVAADDEEELPL
jgi:chaperonin GroEL (HSP60 family)